MTLSDAFALGLLQGATEFLPVSSSGHLVLAKHLLDVDLAAGSGLLFDLFVHLGTLLAIVLVLRRRVGQIGRAALSYLPGGSAADASDRRWLWLIAAGSVPTALLGLGLYGAVEAMQARPAWVGVALLATAAILFASERTGARRRSRADLGWSDALLIGGLQGLAVLPGISRSGATVAGGLLRDVDAETAVEFSMLLSIPAILGASALELAGAGTGVLSAAGGALAAGFVAAFAMGALCLKALQWAVRQRRLKGFAAYCGCVGLGAVWLG